MVICFLFFVIDNEVDVNLGDKCWIYGYGAINVDANNDNECGGEWFSKVSWGENKFLLWLLLWNSTLTVLEVYSW